MLSESRLLELLDRIPRLNIGLIGDLFLDRYLEVDGQVHELSIETGLEAYQVTAVRNSAGALGTVLQDLAALGVGQLVPISVIGDDGHGYDLLRCLDPLPLDRRWLLQLPERLTPTYTKPMVGVERSGQEPNQKELNRLDVRSRVPLGPHATQHLLAGLADVWDRCDGLIVLDQIAAAEQGVVTAAVRAELERLGRQRPDWLVFVDSRAHLHRFASGVLKGNQHECQAAAGSGRAPSESPEAAVAQLARRTGRPAYCTCGEQGILVADPAGSIERVPGITVPGPVDIVGAGDAVTSGLVAAWLAGGTPVEAAEVGNLVASITVQQLGTTGTATRQQVIARHRQLKG